nr:hypothetical protein [Tanacetum cinerariifolium]
ATPPKPKDSVWKTKSSSDTTITPLIAAAGPRQTTFEKGKQAAKASKAKSLSALSENTQQFGALLPIELTNKDIRNSNAYKDYYAVATGATPPKPKASFWKTRSSFDTTGTPLTAVAGPGLSTSAKGKQPPTTSKAKSLSAFSEMKELILYQGFSMYPLMNLRKKSLRIPLMKKVIRMKERMVMVMMKEMMVMMVKKEMMMMMMMNKMMMKHKMMMIRKMKGMMRMVKRKVVMMSNGEENLGMNVGREEGQDKEDEADKLYRDVNINLGRGIQLGVVHTTQEVEDSHVTLTPVNPDGQQQSSFVSS